MAMVLTARALSLQRLLPVDKPSATVPVVVAQEAIPAYTKLAASMLAVRSYPPSLRPQGSLSTISAAVGRWVTVPLQPGEPVLSADLLAASTTPIPAALLQPGEVAVSVQLSAVQAAGGWVHPGQAVALYQVTAKGAQVLVNPARVLTVNGSLANTVSTPLSGTALLTLAVPNAQAGAVLAAAASGGLQIVLVPPPGK